MNFNIEVGLFKHALGRGMGWGGTYHGMGRGEMAWHGMAYNDFSIDVT